MLHGLWASARASIRTLDLAPAERNTFSRVSARRFFAPQTHTPQITVKCHLRVPSKNRLVNFFLFNRLTLNAFPLLRAIGARLYVEFDGLSKRSFWCLFCLILALRVSAQISAYTMRVAIILLCRNGSTLWLHLFNACVARHLRTIMPCSASAHYMSTHRSPTPPRVLKTFYNYNTAFAKIIFVELDYCI